MWSVARMRAVEAGTKPSDINEHHLQVELGCSREFAKAYAFARCGLAAAYQNLSQADVCHYAPANLSAVSIRLGE